MAIKKLKVEKLPKMKAKSPGGKEADLALEHGQLAVDVFQTDKEFFVRAPIAGVCPEDVEVLVDNEMLIIKGQRQEQKSEEEPDYFYHECFWGAFERQIILPEDIDKNKIKAGLERGVLVIRAPRIKTSTKQKIKIKEFDD